MHGHFPRQTDAVFGQIRWRWLEIGELKKETKGRELDMMAQEKMLRTKYNSLEVKIKP